MEKMNLLKKMKLQRTMTNNEKKLLILLGIVIVLWATFRFVILPQHTKLQALTDEKNEYEEKISRVNLILKKEGKIQKQWEDLHTEKIALSNKYFPIIDQPQIIYLLNEILNNEDMNVLDINFSRPKEEYIGDLTVNTMDIYIPYKAKYEGLLETIKGITFSPKKMLITNLTMDKDEGEVLAGNISVKIYGLDGIEELDNNMAYITIISNSEKDNPFIPFDYFDKSTEEGLLLEDENNLINLEENINIEENYNKELLEDFESGSFNFIPSNQYVKGNVYRSVNSISDKYSIRFEYNIFAFGDENRAYLDLFSKDIVIKYPPSSIGLWIYSYGYSPVTLGIRFKGQADEKVEVELSKGISWIGWKYVQVSLPSDLSLYPLQLDKIYIDLAYNRDDYGVLIFDKIEANYPKESNNTNNSFTFYVVEKGDTLDEISLKFYGTIKKKNIILKYNEINSDKDIREGKVLVIPR